MKLTLLTVGAMAVLLQWASCPTGGSSPPPDTDCSALTDYVPPDIAVCDPELCKAAAAKNKGCYCDSAMCRKGDVAKCTDLKCVKCCQVDADCKDPMKYCDQSAGIGACHPCRDKQPPNPCNYNPNNYGPGQTPKGACCALGAATNPCQSGYSCQPYSIASVPACASNCDPSKVGVCKCSSCRPRTSSLRDRPLSTALTADDDCDCEMPDAGMPDAGMPMPDAGPPRACYVDAPANHSLAAVMDTCQNGHFPSGFDSCSNYTASCAQLCGGSGSCVQGSCRSSGAQLVSSGGCGYPGYEDHPEWDVRCVCGGK